MAALPWLALIAAGATVQLDAERLIHDDARKITTAEGEAELVAHDAALHADRVTYDANASMATASGHVALRLKRGLLAVLADVISLRLEGDEVVEIFIYDGL